MTVDSPRQHLTWLVTVGLELLSNCMTLVALTFGKLFNER